VRVIAYRHSPFEDLGFIADALDAHGILYDYADLYASPAAAPPIWDADALIVLGGAMSANDDLAYLHSEIEHIGAAIRGGKPVLGVCLGAQLTARALGARVHRNPVKEIGWGSVAFTPAAKRDALFNGLDGFEMMFQWHGETFDLPPGAELLATSSRCRHQAFRLGDRIYGLQFHLEATPAIIRQWCREDAACGDAREATEPIDTSATNVYGARTKDLARLVFGRWCDLVKGQTRTCAVP
jgi:GMP synthase-like glutamine amidotransferase